jgi:acetyl esterase/lipase
LVDASHAIAFVSAHSHEGTKVFRLRLFASNVDTFLFLIPALLLALLSLLTVRLAPDTMLAWKVAILATEFGHWLLLLPVALGATAYFQTNDGWRVATCALCGFASVCFLRPAFSAWQLSRGIPFELERAFGPQTPRAPVFSWARLLFSGGVAKAKVFTARVTSADGVELAMDIYRDATATQPQPCVVVIHGGGWDGGDRRQLFEWNDWLAERGYVVAAVSYRLAPRWQWPAQRDDVTQAIAWLKAHAAECGIDASRFVLFGRSAGGQIASAVGYGAGDPAIRGVVALYAPHDMPFVWSVSREDDALNSLRLMRQYLGGPPAEERRVRYESASAQFLAQSDSPPTLLIHGVPDTLSWVRHSVRLSARLKELKVPHYFLRLPWATHGFDFNRTGPGGQLAAYSIEWFLASVTR